jgi:exopolysaccharide biosynthesis polyprenyl glycosylphosphotransferase
MSILDSHAPAESRLRQHVRERPHEIRPNAGDTKPEPSDNWRSRYLHRLRLLDAVAIIAAMTIAQFVRFGDGFDDEGMTLFNQHVPYWTLGLVLAALWWMALGASGGRHVRLVGQGAEASRKVLATTMAVFGTVAILSYVFGLPTARGYILVALPTGLLLILALRMAAQKLLLRRRTSAAENMSRTLILGRRLAAEQVMNHMEANPAAGLKPVAIYHPRRDDGPLVHEGNYDSGTQYLRGRPSVDEILLALESLHADSVVVTDETGLTPKEVRRFGWALADAGVRLILAPSLSGIAGPRIHSQPLNGLPLIHVSTPQLTGIKKQVKRGFDLIASSALLLLISPVLLVVSLIIKLSDGGPVFFRQKRVGVNRSEFQMYKFRSMVPNAEALRQDLDSDQGDGNVLFKIKGDPRITRVGRFIRKYSIDELPQLLNVLLGHMSLVGPRPPLPAEVERYEDDAHRRLLVLPGITGLWQVSGRSDLSWEQSVHLDLYYVENWSLSSDILILFKTLKATLKPDGAY